MTVVLALAGVTAALGIGTAFGHGSAASDAQTWTTVYKSSIEIEGLTLDDDGNLYVPQRGGRPDARSSASRRAGAQVRPAFRSRR